MSNGVTLYYPFIHPRDENFMKAALLFWSKVRRIVPESVTVGDKVDGDTESVQKLTDSGLLISTDPAPYTKVTSETFLKILDTSQVDLRIGKSEAEELRTRHVNIHVEKIAYEILVALDERGVARRSGDWVTMRDEVGILYMHCLASSMSDAMSAPLLADSTAHAEFGETFLFNPLLTSDLARATRLNPTETLLQLGLPLPTPEALAGVTIDKVIRFVNRNASEKQAFRNAIEGILQAASEVTDSNELADYLSDKRTSIQSAIKNLEKSLGEIRVISVGNAAKITIPAAFSAGAKALPFGPIGVGIAAAIGLAIAAISIYAETRGKLRQARLGSPYHYIIRLKKKLKAG